MSDTRGTEGSYFKHSFLGTTLTTSQGCIISNIKKEEKWLQFLSPKALKPKNYKQGSYR